MFGVGLNGYRHQQVSTDASLDRRVHHSSLRVLPQPDPHRTFSLVSADLILLNSEAVALEADFIILRQIGAAEDRATSSISQRALKAANAIMSVFGASDHCEDREQVAELVKKCRAIAASVLGQMGAEDRKKLCTADKGAAPDAKMWAIGHWFVFPPPKAMRLSLSLCPRSSSLSAGR